MQYRNTGLKATVLSGVAAFVLAGASYAQTTTYTYDALGRLTSTDRGTVGGRADYAYDPANNRVSVATVAGVPQLPVITGTQGDDTLVGTSAAEQFNALGGNDQINLQGGADVVNGGAAWDTIIFLGSRNDYVFRQFANGSVQARHVATNVLITLNDTESVYFLTSNDWYVITDVITEFEGGTFTGTPGDDMLTGTLGNDQMYGLAGNDQLVGQGGADLINGGDGWDTVHFLGARVDYSFYQLASGTVQAKRLSTNVIANLVNNESVWFSGSGQWFTLPDVITDGEGGTFTGTAGDDTLTGTIFADQINGLGGNDQLVGQGGTDTINGGDGWDTIHFPGARTDYTFYQWANGSVEAKRTATNIIATVWSGEAVWFQGSSQWFTMGDVITGAQGGSFTGTSGDDSLAGTAGDDTFQGLAGNDQITTGAGTDIVDGGADWDTALVPGGLSDYTYVRLANGSVVATHTSSGKTKTLVAMEAVWFLATSQYAFLSDLAP